MKINKPNHVCKYSGCNLGEDGGRKHYYACDYCDRTNSWRSAACCIEHYDLYVKEVLDARAKNQKIDALPERLDKSEDDVKELLSSPINEVKENTKNELKEYLDDGKTIEEAVESINEDIDKQAKNKRKRNKNN